MINKMLVPVDGSVHSQKALELACDLASRSEADLSIVHVLEWAPGQQTLAMGAASVSIPPEPEAIEVAGRPVLDEATALAEKHGVRVANADVLYGPPAKSILEAAKSGDIDTIVIGSRGLGDLAGLLLGSVSHKVSQLAPCTCIVVR